MNLDRYSRPDPEDVDANDANVVVPDGTRDLRQGDLMLISTLAGEVRRGHRDVEGFPGIRCFRKVVSVADTAGILKRIVVFEEGRLTWSPVDRDFKLCINGDRRIGDARYVLMEGDRMDFRDLDSLSRMMPEVKKGGNQTPEGLSEEVALEVGDFLKKQATSWNEYDLWQEKPNQDKDHITPPSENDGGPQCTDDTEEWYDTSYSEIAALKEVATVWLITDQGRGGKKWHVDISRIPFAAIGCARDDVALKLMVRKGHRPVALPMDVLHQIGHALSYKRSKKGHSEIVYDDKVLKPYR